MTEKTKKINLRIDYVLLILFLIGSIYFLIETLIGQLIPLKYVLIAGFVIFALFAIIFYTFRFHNVFVYVIRKIVLVLLCAILGIGAIFQTQLRSAFLHVNNASVSIDRMHVIVLDNSNFETIDDVVSLAYVDQLNDLTTYSLKQLDQESLTKYPVENLTTGFSVLDNREIDALLISEQEHTFEVEKEDSTYAEKYRIIHTIEREVQNTNITIDKDLKEPFVVYVSGLDNVGQPNYNGLSDVNMLLMVDPQNHHVEMISINRDTYVPNKKFGDYPDKLTHLGWQGVEAGAEALERVFGIEIDYTVKVTFESLIKIIDALGGIDVDVQISFTEQDENRSFKSEDLIHLEKGFQHLNGKEALAYARHRKSAGWGVKGREQAQRDIIAAVVDKVLSVEGALKIGDVMNVAASYVATNLPMSSAKGFVMNAIEDGSPWTFGSRTVDSQYEFLMPTASYPYQDLYAVLLSEKDMQQIHDMYVNMNKELHLNEFEFDLNNMSQYAYEYDFDEKVITVENYYSVVPTYFPSYVRYNY